MADLILSGPTCYTNVDRYWSNLLTRCSPAIHFLSEVGKGMLIVDKGLFTFSVVLWNTAPHKRLLTCGNTGRLLSDLSSWHIHFVQSLKRTLLDDGNLQIDRNKSAATTSAILLIGSIFALQSSSSLHGVLFWQSFNLFAVELVEIWNFVTLWLLFHTNSCFKVWQGLISQFILPIRKPRDYPSRNFQQSCAYSATTVQQR